MFPNLLSASAFSSIYLYPKWIIWLFFILCAVFITVSLIHYRKTQLNKTSGGIDANGLKRHFFFTADPYKRTLGISACIAVSFAAVVLLMVAIGGIAWLLLWIVKLLCFTIYYLGWIALILGAGILVFEKDAEGLVPGIPGLLIVCFGNPIKHFARACVEWGENIWSSFNVFFFAKDIVVNYWLHGIIITMTPIAIFLIIALLWMAFALCLRLYDRISTRFYSVHHPCPYCQEDSEPAVYYSKGIALNTELRPGVYGLFHITHPETQEKMPTLLMTGRSALVRQCHNCGSFINTEDGIDKHIAMVGGPGSGKTALSITLLGILKSRCKGLIIGDDVTQDIKSAIEKIAVNGRIKENEFPNKTAEGLIPSLRANIIRYGKPPYALYVNDVAGELFQPGREVSDDLKFMYHTTSIVFLIDPTTAILKNAGSKMKQWMEKNKGLLNPVSDIEEIYESVRTYINSINRLDKMTITYALVKTDTGYANGIDSKNPEAIKRFIEEELGLTRLSTGEFGFEHYFAVSTIENDGNIEKLASALLEQQQIAID